MGNFSHLNLPTMPLHKLDPPRIAIVTYNSFYHYEPGVHEVYNFAGRPMKMLLLPYTFNPSRKEKSKSPSNVHRDDPNFKMLLEHEKGLSDIVQFLGKIKPSGSDEIIKIMCETFDMKKLFFISCDHDFKQKLRLLKQYKVPESQYSMFRDSHTQCKESDFLLGKASGFALQ